MKTQIQYKLKVLLLTFACMLCAGSCQRDETMPENLGDTVNLGLNLGTYALGDSDSNAYPHEKKINNLYVFIYNSEGLLENPNNTHVMPASDGSVVDAAGRVNGTWTVYEGDKKVFVIANAPTQLTTQTGVLLSAGILDHPTLDELRNLCSSAGAFLDDYFYNQDDAWTGGLMSGSVESVAVSTSADEITVPLTRRYARIDLRVRKAPELADAVVEGYMLLYNNYSTQASLISNSSGEWNSSQLGSNCYDNFSLPVELDYVPVEVQMNGHNSRIYTAPRPKSLSASAGAIKLQLSVRVNGREELYEVALVETNSDGTQNLDRPLDIEANKIYKVDATLSRRSIDVEIQIEDWDDQLVSGDVAGTMLTVSESKIIMDWVNLGQRFDTGVDYISDGLVEFVGYVIKNSNGTDQSITTDGSNLPTWLPKAKITNLPNGTTNTGRIGLEYVVTSEATHPDVVIRIKTGNITKDIRIIYDNGFIPNSLLLVNGWPTNQPGLGVILAKRGNRLPSDVPMAEDVKLQWSPNTTLAVSAARQRRGGYGLLNTIEIITALGGEATAANHCSQLGKDWYLSSEAELLTFFMQSPQYCLGASYLIDSDSYWTSSEVSANTSYVVNSVASSSNPDLKTNMHKLRCVRNAGISLSTSLLIADWYDWGQSFSTDVEFESIVGDVSIRAIENSGPGKNWLKSAVISGREKGKITITYEPTGDVLHHDVQISLKTSKGGSAIFNVRYGNGFIPNSLLIANGWTENLPSKGLLLAKKGNTLINNLALVDDEQLIWSTTPAVTVGSTSQALSTGLSNTRAIVAALGADAPAAFKCQSIGLDWYLPSKEELRVMHALRFYAAGTYRFGVGFYWSSSESTVGRCWYMGFGTNNLIDNPKTVTTNVRCVKNI